MSFMVIDQLTVVWQILWKESDWKKVLIVLKWGLKEVYVFITISSRRRDYFIIKLLTGIVYYI